MQFGAGARTPSAGLPPDPWETGMNPRLSSLASNRCGTLTRRA